MDCKRINWVDHFCTRKCDVYRSGTISIQKFKYPLLTRGFIQTCKMLIKSKCPPQIISKWYNLIVAHKGENTSYVEDKWEREGGLTIVMYVRNKQDIKHLVWILLEEHDDVFCYSSDKTPIGTGSTCSRCGNNRANYFHILWNHQEILVWDSWTLHNVCFIDFPMSFESLFLGKRVLYGLTKQKTHKKLLYIVLAARKWLKPVQPTTEDW